MSESTGHSTDAPNAGPSVRVQLHRRRAASLTGWLALVGMVFVPMLARSNADLTAIAAVLTSVMVCLTVYFRATNRLLDGRLEISPDALSVITPRRRRTFGYASVKRARVLPAGNGRRVEWTLRSGSVLTLHFDRADEADALAAAARLGARHVRYETSLGRTSHRVAGGVCAFALSAWAVFELLDAFMPPVRPAPFPLLLTSVVGGAIVLTTGLLSVFRPPHVTVGAEGLDLRVSVWRYFIPYRTLRAVHLVQDNLVVFTYTDGRQRSLYASVPRAESDALILRIDDARRVYAGQASRGDDAGTLLRAGRPVSTWRADLRAQLDAARSYRDAHLDRDALRRVLEDPDAPAERRIGAALALSDPCGDPADHVRVVAARCASEPLRVALERVASTTLDDAAVDAAIDHERTQRRL
ncbi:MAG: hypothetical protein WCJ30_12375 [Deltaproteobacteria bacterium]